MKSLRIVAAILILSMFSCGDLTRDNKFDPKAGSCPGYPIADFTVNDGDAAALQQQPSIFSAAVSKDPGGTAMQYRWYFASDGEWSAWSSAETVSRNYLVVSSEEVSLEVVNELGMIDSVKKTVQIVDSQPPTAAFTYSPSNPSVGNAVTFDASSSTDDDTGAAEIMVRWDFANDGVFDTDWSIVKTANHAYTSAGIVTAKLAVKDRYGLGGTATKSIAVQAVPTYTVTYNANGATGGDVPSDSTEYKQGENITVLGNTGILVNIQGGISLTFQGWNTKADGSGTTYTQGQVFAIGTLNITLYAKWSSIIGATGPAGGLIFYDKGSYSGSPSWRYLEAAPSDQSTGAVWGCSGTTLTGADGTAVGTGNQNTIDIETGCTAAGTAADICANLTIGIYSDWFLPSRDELNLMYTNLKAYGVGGFAVTTVDYYWSSSESNASYAWYQYFLNGSQNIYYSKGSAGYVRAVRAF